MPSIINDYVTEILLHIFMFNSAQDCYHPHDPTATAMATSQVCRRWRQITLDYPPLWTVSVDLSKPVLLLRNAILPRCSGHNLDTVLFPSITEVFLQSEHWRHIARKDNEVPIVEILSEHDFETPDFAERLSLIAPLPAQNTRNLILKISDDEWFALDTSLFSQDMSHLDMLVLMVDPAIWADRDECSLVGLDETLQAASTPWMMRILQLQGFGVNLKSKAFATLEELVVHYLPISVGYTPARMLDVLKGMPNLKRLDLVDVTLTTEWQDQLFGHPQILTDLKDCVELPHLDYLKLSGPIDHIANLFCKVKFPTSCNLKLVCETMNSILNPEDPIHKLLEDVSGRFWADKMVFIGKLAVEVSPGMCCFRVPEEPNNVEPLHLSFTWDPRLSYVSETRHEPLIDPLIVFNLVSLSLGKLCHEIRDLDLRYPRCLPTRSCIAKSSGNSLTTSPTSKYCPKLQAVLSDFSCHISKIHFQLGKTWKIGNQVFPWMPCGL